MIIYFYLDEDSKNCQAIFLANGLAGVTVLGAVPVDQVELKIDFKKIYNNEAQQFVHKKTYDVVLF
jgi:hypothetical protein